jgi:hypothetical protein
MAPGVEIMSTGNHVTAYLLYFLNPRHGWCYGIHKKQASSPSIAMQLLKPLLDPLEYLGWGIGDVSGIDDRDNIGKVESAMFEEGEVKRLHRAYFGIGLVSESPVQPWIKLVKSLLGHGAVPFRMRVLR